MKLITRHEATVPVISATIPLVFDGEKPKLFRGRISIPDAALFFSNDGGSTVLTTNFCYSILKHSSGATTLFSNRGLLAALEAGAEKNLGYLVVFPPLSSAGSTLLTYAVESLGTLYGEGNSAGWLAGLSTIDSLVIQANVANGTGTFWLDEFDLGPE